MTARYESLYGRKCRSPLHWSEVDERTTSGPDVLQDIEEKVRIVHQRLLTAQGQQKNYFDKRRCDLTFSVRDHVFIKISPTKGVVFGMRAKLSPHFLGPCEVLERVSPVTYWVALPPDRAGVHNAFHVSLLRKYVYNWLTLSITHH